MYAFALINGDVDPVKECHKTPLRRIKKGGQK